MAFVKARYNESIDSLLKRFKRAVERAGILSDLRKYEFYEKPSVRKKKKQAAARKRAMKMEKKLDNFRDRKGTNQNFRWNKDKTKKIPLKPKTQESGYKGKNNRPSYSKNDKPIQKGKTK